mgnify:CR=1 FL=1
MPEEVKIPISQQSFKDVKDIQKSFKDILGTLDAISTKKVRFSGIDEVTKSKEKRLKVDKSINASLRMLKQEEKNYAIAVSKTGKELAKLRVQTQAVKKAHKEQAKSALGLLSPYDRLSKRLTDLKKKAKEARKKNKSEKKKSISQASLVNQSTSSNNTFQLLLLFIGVIEIIVAALPTSKKNQ